MLALIHRRNHAAARPPYGPQAGVAAVAAAAGPSVVLVMVLVAAPLVLGAVLAGPAMAQVTVPGQANIYGAGHDVPPAPGGGGGGVLPTLVGLPPGTGRTVTFTGVTGELDYGPCCPPNGPDGVEVSDAFPAPIWDGLAGTDLPVRARFLVGVFLDDTEPADPAPERLVFADGAFASLAPGLRQIFFVGDGLTGTEEGAEQVFAVPDAATRLFLGVQDRFDSDPNVPGYYGDNSGAVELTVTVDGVPTAVGNPPPALAQPVLWQNAPNPFNPATMIRWDLPDGGGHVDLAVFDLRGRHVRQLVTGHSAAGSHAVRWDGSDDGGQRVAAGAYVCRLSTRSGVRTIRMVLLP